MNFCSAMLQVLDGAPMRRQHWPKGDQLQAQVPDEHSKMTQPYLYLSTDEEIRVPYVLTNSDIFGRDWEEVLPEMTQSSIDPFS